MNPQRVETLVIGSGQAGLAVGYHLAQHGLQFLIVDENERVGDVWRRRWDSLRLFTPARYSQLPGMRFPAPRASYPSKDQMADYLESYAIEFDLPVRTGITVDRVTPVDDSYHVAYGDDAFISDNVVVATGAYRSPRIPSFAPELDTGIVQIHSSAYRNTSQLQPGGTLVVGAGNSGAEIAMEAAREHQTWLSGPDPGQEPTPANGALRDRALTPLVWFMASKVLNVSNPLGRKVRDHFLDPPRGIPVARVRRKDILAAGIQRVGRTTGVRDGLPTLEDGRVVQVANVVWCTGYEIDFSWIRLPVFGPNGYPVHRRGVVESQPGLYFMGLLFQSTLSSGLVGGVGRDARYVAGHIASSGRARSAGGSRGVPDHSTGVSDQVNS